jgi:hypothetical protein
MNGYQDPVRRSVDRVIDDWFSLLDHEHWSPRRATRSRTT